ncbi:hypothetical protein BHE74_00019037 [Ensete ventricosum]|nr:hypothetical protein BHE74_00019037 [Ensete ventricosum]
MGGNPLWVGRYRLALAGYCPCRRPPLAGGLTTAGRPCRGPGRGQSPLHADSMHVAAPPPQTAPTFAANRCNKRVEQFYAIQSHHTQFKTNFLHENLSSDTTVGKPQRVAPVTSNAILASSCSPSASSRQASDTLGKLPANSRQAFDPFGKLPTNSRQASDTFGKLSLSLSVKFPRRDSLHFSNSFFPLRDSLWQACDRRSPIVQSSKNPKK